jgi:predicted amidohydrolase
LLSVGAVNGIDEFEDATLLGRSAVYDSWRKSQLRARANMSASSFTDIDPETVTDRRAEFPAFDDRRSE